MKRVLIVTPNWPPVSYPDMHRVRMALPFFAEFGWEPLILKVNPDEQQGIKDSVLSESIPEDVRVWQAGALPRGLTAWAGLNSVGLRSLLHLCNLGRRIIRQERPDVAFFSTTMFPVMSLGRVWHSRHGLPYVLDFQDPWVRDDLGRSTPYAVDMKARVMRAIDKMLEPYSLRHASHILSVSPAYPPMLMRRYPWLSVDRFTVLPFGAAESDFAFLTRRAVCQNIFDPKDGKRHWVYIGRGGDDMGVAVRSLMAAVSRARSSEPDRWGDLRLHFIGTDYAPGAQSRRTIVPIAEEYGVADIVEELPRRVPYFEALACLRDAHALVVIGSRDAGYTGSKLFPYILANRPLLVICHRQSSMARIAEATRSAVVVRFDEASRIDAVAQSVLRDWMNGADRNVPATDWAAFKPFSAREMTRRICGLFDRAACV